MSQEDSNYVYLYNPKNKRKTRVLKCQLNANRQRGWTECAEPLEGAR